MKPNKASSVVTFILGIGFNLAILAVIVYAMFHFTQRGFDFGSYFASTMLEEGPDYEVIFVLEEDTPRAEVAQMLYLEELIANPWLFRLEMFLKNSTRVYRAGTYILNRQMTNTDINATLRRGQTAAAVGEERITVREGWTIRDMAYYFEYRGFFPQQEFIDYTQDGIFNFHFLDNVPDLPGRTRLEGYLFPDTYNIPMNPTPRDIIIRMLIRFEDIMEGAWLQRAYELGYTFDEIMIMASIIEGETGRADERAKVAQVIQRRLNVGMRLQMDATAIYILDIHPSRVMQYHLDMDSPYNTHTRDGLPIGPIGNPGRASIEAALNPTNTNYLFFVVDYSDHSRHVFNTNYPDHNAAAQRFWASLG